MVSDGTVNEVVHTSSRFDCHDLSSSLNTELSLEELVQHGADHSSKRCVHTEKSTTDPSDSQEH